MRSPFVFITSVFCCLAANFCLAQSNQIKGLVVDAADKHPIKEALVSVFRGSDSVLVGFARTDTTGHFIVKLRVAQGYWLKVSHLGYLTTTAKVDSTYWVEIRMSKQEHFLEEVVVKTDKPAARLKNDTLEYDASYFKTREGANVEELLKKLPGIQVDKDGKIKVNGQEVQKVMVDGKEFFSNDPKMATRNLPATVVNKVQVFERKSAQAQFSGFDDGNSEQTINLTLKEDKKTGLFGNLEAGAGSKERFESGGQIHIFKKNDRFSIIAKGNNTGKQDFSSFDAMTTGAGGDGVTELQINVPGSQQAGRNGGEGIKTTLSGGGNYNATWGKKAEVFGSYFFSDVKDIAQRSSIREYSPALLLPNYEATGYNKKQVQTHRFHFALDQVLDSFNSIRWESSNNFQGTSESKDESYRSFLKNTTVNTGLAQSGNKGYSASLDNSFLWRHRFAKKGRTLSVKAQAYIRSCHMDKRYALTNEYFDTSGQLRYRDSINQLRNQQDPDHQYKLRVSYTEPFSRRSLLEFSAQSTYQNGGQRTSTFDYDPASKQYSFKNSMLSNEFDGSTTVLKTGINWLYYGKKWEFQPGIDIQRTTLQSSYRFGQDSQIKKLFTDPVINIRYVYKPSRFQNVRLHYRTYTVQPTGTQLNPLENNSDPQHIRTGNPDLRPEYIHALRMQYSSLDPYRHRNFFASIQLTKTKNKITTAEIIDHAGGRKEFPINTEGSSVDGFLNKGLPAGGGYLRLNNTFRFTRNVSFLNGKVNKTNHFQLSPQVGFDYWYKEKLEISNSFSAQLNRVLYSMTPEKKTFADYRYDMNVSWYVSKKASFASEFSYTLRSGYSTAENRLALWNVGVGHKILKNQRGEVRIQAFDLLRQNLGLKRNVQPNYQEETRTHLITNYYLISFTYSLSQFGATGGEVIRAPF